MHHLLLGLTLLGLCLADTTFVIPPGPNASCSSLDATPVSLSFEFFAFPEYFLNDTNTQNCLETLKQLSGKWPRIRIGGTSEDTAIFDPTLNGLVEISESNNPDFPTTRYGPGYVELAGSYPGNIIFGLNRGGDNITNTIEAANFIKKNLSNLEAFELGNEPEIYAYGGFPIAPDPATWTQDADIASQIEWQRAVGDAINSDHIFQAGNYYLYNYTGTYLLGKEAEAGALKFVADFSHHLYPQNEGRASPVTPGPNLTALMMHERTSDSMTLYTTDANAVRAYGVNYVLGETNSVSGGGSPLISATFGAALWTLDHTLRAVSGNITRLYYHHGEFEGAYSSYAWWTPTTVRSVFYGAYVAARTLAEGGFICALDDGKSAYAGYAVYSDKGKLLRVALLNTDYYENGTRTTERITLMGVQDQAEAKAARLTAPSAMARQDKGELTTFGDQTFGNYTCKLSGNLKAEPVNFNSGRASVMVAASEALLLEF